MVDDDLLVEEGSGWSQDQRAEYLLGALVCVVVALLLLFNRPVGGYH